MRAAVISDLHLCSDTSCREFRLEESAFVGFLDALEATHDVVVVAGDVFNLDHARRLFDFDGELLATERRYKRLVARLRSSSYLMVHGNHDAALARRGVAERLRFELGDVRFVALHGHQFDGRMKRLPGVSPTGSWAAAWLRRVDLDVGADVLVRLGSVANTAGARLRVWTGGASRAGLRRDEAGAEAVLRAEQADVVVMGHVHRPVVRRFPGLGLYVNGGNCSFGRLSFASVDTTDLSSTRLHEAAASAEGIGHLERALAARADDSAV